MKKQVVSFILLSFMLLGGFSACPKSTAKGLDNGYKSVLDNISNLPVINTLNANTNSIECEFKNKTYKLNLQTDIYNTKMQQNVNKCNLVQKKYIIDKILKMGFNMQVALNYVFPSLKRQVEQISANLLILPQDAKPVADNSNNISFKECTEGQVLDLDKLYNDIYNNLLTGDKINLSTIITNAEYKISDIKKNYKLAGSFYTTYETSGQARKSNIKTACSAINGIIIKNGETFSFNSATGPRGAENGYKEAKIIVNNKYTEGFGGGVCQVSSTLYNACLLAGLDITEVHNHSLPASYVNPCFDAMVNTGSSDLKVTNNTGYDCIITASANNNRCKVVIYGKPPEYKIVRRFEKYQTLPMPDDIIETDASKYEGEIVPGRHQIAYGAEGFKARGYLDYYNGDILVKSKKIRDNTYNPKQGIVLIVE